MTITAWGVSPITPFFKFLLRAEKIQNQPRLNLTVCQKEKILISRFHFVTSCCTSTSVNNKACIKFLFFAHWKRRRSRTPSIPVQRSSSLSLRGFKHPKIPYNSGHINLFFSLYLKRFFRFFIKTKSGELMNFEKRKKV